MSVTIYGLTIRDLKHIQGLTETEAKQMLENLYLLKARIDEHPEYPETYIIQAFWEQRAAKKFGKRMQKGLTRKIL